MHKAHPSAYSTHQIPLGKLRSNRVRDMDTKFSGNNYNGQTQRGNKKVRRKQQMGDYERWEVQQLVRSGVLSVEDNPDFDEEHGVLGFEETEAELDVELNDVQPTFIRSMMMKNPALLHGGGSQNQPTPIVKVPEGSLQRAAENQQEFARERREAKAQKQEILGSIPKDLNRPWPIPWPTQERYLAAELRGIGLNPVNCLCPNGKLKRDIWGFVSKIMESR